MTSLVRITPRTLREKLQYTDNIDQMRDKCRTAEAIITPIVERAWLDMLLFGTGVVPVRWEKS